MKASILSLMAILASTTTGTLAMVQYRSQKPSLALSRRDDWNYGENDEGPQDWSHLNPMYGACGNGTQQSPIDLEDRPTDNPPNVTIITGQPLNFTYHPIYNATIGYNGHAVQIDWNYTNTSIVPPPTNATVKNTLTWKGKEYILQQAHFHTPSEHHVDGSFAPAEMHMVHTTADGKDIAVLGILFKIQIQSNPFFEFITQLDNDKKKAQNATSSSLSSSMSSTATTSINGTAHASTTSQAITTGASTTTTSPTGIHYAAAVSSSSGSGAAPPPPQATSSHAASSTTGSGSAAPPATTTMPPSNSTNHTGPDYVKDTIPMINFDDLLDNLTYFANRWEYIGSLTTPPCTEGVQWFVSKNVVDIGYDEWNALVDLERFNARYVQDRIWPSNGTSTNNGTASATGSTMTSTTTWALTSSLTTLTSGGGSSLTTLPPTVSQAPSSGTTNNAGATPVPIVAPGPAAPPS